MYVVQLCVYARTLIHTYVHVCRDFYRKRIPGGHIEAFYTLGGGGLAMYPSAHTQGGMIHLGGVGEGPL